MTSMFRLPSVSSLLLAWPGMVAAWQIGCACTVLCFDKTWLWLSKAAHSVGKVCKVGEKHWQELHEILDYSSCKFGLWCGLHWIEALCSVPAL